MDAVVVAGSFVGGSVAGAVLCTLTGRIVRPAPPEPAPSEPAPPDPAPPDPAAERGAVATVAPGAVAVRVPPKLELAVSALLTGLWFALAAIRIGDVPALGAYCALGVGLVAASVVDARDGIVPRVIVFPTLAVAGGALVAASVAAAHEQPLLDAAIGGAIAFCVFFTLWWCFPRGLGYGDVRLAGLIGVALSWLGFGELYVGFLFAFVAGTVLGVALMVLQGTGRKTTLPFAPPLALGAAFGCFFGAWALHLWLPHT